MVLEKIRFNWPITNKNWLWRPYLMSHRHGIWQLYTIVFVQAVSEENIFRNWSPLAVMFVKESDRNEKTLQRTFHRSFLPSFGSFGQAVSEKKIQMW